MVETKDNSYKLTLYKNIGITFKHFNQMLIFVILLWLLAEDHIVNYFTSSEDTVNTTSESDPPKYVTINSYKATLSELQEARLEDYVTTKSEITGLMMLQEKRITDEIRRIKIDFAAEVEKLLDKKLEGINNTNSTDTFKLITDNK